MEWLRQAVAMARVSQKMVARTIWHDSAGQAMGTRKASGAEQRPQALDLIGPVELGQDREDVGLLASPESP